MMKLYFITFGLLFLVNTTISKAQPDSTDNCKDCCCFFEPTPIGVMNGHVHQKKQGMIGYRFMRMSMGNMMNGSALLTDEEIFTNYLMSADHMTMNMHMLMGMYGLTDRFTVMGMFHFQQASMEMKMMEGSDHDHAAADEDEHDAHMHTSGVSDVNLQALYGLVNNKRHKTVLGLGVSLPIGSIYVQGDEHSVYANQRLPYAMQLGSGTFDVMPSISYLFSKYKWSLGVQVNSTIRTGENKLKYRLGNSASGTAWVAYKWLVNFSTSLRTEVSFHEQIQGMDITLYPFYEPAANPLNYGGQTYMGYIGSVYVFKKGILSNNNLGIEYGIPIYQNLFGPQMGGKSMLILSWALRF